MVDFGDDEHPNMICVNAGHVATPVTLLPQQGFEASLILQVVFCPACTVFEGLKRDMIPVWLLKTLVS